MVNNGKKKLTNAVIFNSDVKTRSCGTVPFNENVHVRLKII